jgi:two-component system nitrogen regulation sensor histidine kinase NtrY
MATYALLTGLIPFSLSTAGLIAVMLVNFVLVLTLGGLIAWRLAKLWAERRSGIAGARLHVRLVALFAAVAIVPTILVAVFAAVTLNLGMEAWFSTRVQAALSSAIQVAEDYEHDHETVISTDAVATANAIAQDQQLYQGGKVNTPLLFAKLQDITNDRGILASYILSSKGRIIGSTIPIQSSQALKKPTLPTPANFSEAAKGKVVIDASSKLGIERALIRLPMFTDAYLLVVRPIDPQVLNYFQRTTDTVAEYNRLKQNRADVELVFALLYGIASLLILLVAVWLGIWAAKELVNPISQLIGAAQRVSEGDLRAQVAVTHQDDELGRLGHAFNRMTMQISAQRDELISASHQIDARRRFMEAVLAGVSAGVIGFNSEGVVTLVNRAAARLLNAAPEEMEGHHYSEAVPELSGLIRKAMGEPVGRASGEVIVKRAGATQTLSVQVDSDSAGDFVATFDDITDLVSAQRTAAWADVARRIAHEIKNPLTPIQLSAERLKRKYTREVETDPEIFAQCTDTIIRQVGDIGRMVDEFSSFARMPAPIMASQNFQELLQQSVFLQRVANPQIEFSIAVPADPVRIICDGRLLSQALTNVLKNATEAISARQAKGEEFAAHIDITASVQDSQLRLQIADNGIGLPAEHRNRLTEPYVTTRAKGTGLGLAIVRKIIEDHGGEIALGDRSDDGIGAQVSITLPLQHLAGRAVEMEGEHEQARIADRA